MSIEILKISKLNKKWRDKIVFESYDATIHNRRTCILGENGLGKTTLLSIIAGLEVFESGDIELCNQVLDNPISKVALASDSVLIPPFISAKEVIELQCESFELAWPALLIEQLYFDEHVNKNVGALSAGNLKKLHLITAFMRQPDLLLLDEPNIALDPNSLSALWALIDDYPHNIIVASNEPDTYNKQGFETKHLFDLHK